MAEQKKYLDLNGLGYAIRKIDTKKADIESPVFTGTPTINGVAVATVNDIPSEISDTVLFNQSETPEEELKLTSNTITFAGNNIALTAAEGGAVTYNGNEVATLESPVFTGTPKVPDAPAPTPTSVSTQIANTKWVEDNYIGKKGDATVNGSLTVLGSKFPLLTLKSTVNTSSGYLMNIQGNLMFGDCTSNNASRQYYGRMVPALNQAIVGAVAIGYNPKDNANYQKTTDYGIKIDVDVANSNSATPTIIRQCGSFFVGVNGAYVGYSGSTTKPLNYDTQVYRVLDSNSIKTDEYIASLEARIAALEAKLAAQEEEEEVNNG